MQGFGEGMAAGLRATAITTLERRTGRPMRPLGVSGMRGNPGTVQAR